MNENLRKAREALGLNKQEMAEIIGITGTYYGMIENGHRTLGPAHIKAIVDNTNIRREWIERGELPMFKSEERETTLIEFRKLNEQQQKLVLEMIRQFNELNKSKE